ncbi:hypothetical protein GCM10010483_66150 [Actinokineospora diospyrosa]
MEQSGAGEVLDGGSWVVSGGTFEREKALTWADAVVLSGTERIAAGMALTCVTMG